MKNQGEKLNTDQSAENFESVNTIGMKHLAETIQAKIDTVHESVGTSFGQLWERCKKSLGSGLEKLNPVSVTKQILIAATASILFGVTLPSYLGAAQQENGADNQTPRSITAAPPTQPPYMEWIGYNQEQVDNLVKALKAAKERGETMQGVTLVMINAGAPAPDNPNSKYIGSAKSYIDDDPTDNSTDRLGTTYHQLAMGDNEEILSAIPPELAEYVDMVTAKISDKDNRTTLEVIEKAFADIIAFKKKDPSKPMVVCMDVIAFNVDLDVMRNFIKEGAALGIEFFSPAESQSLDISPSGEVKHYPHAYYDEFGQIVTSMAIEETAEGAYKPTATSNHGGPNVVGAPGKDVMAPDGVEKTTIINSETGAANTINAASAVLIALANQLPEGTKLEKGIVDTIIETRGPAPGHVINLEKILGLLTPPEDINGDFRVDLGDAIDAGKTVVGIPTNVDASKDISGDGKIGVEEMIYMMQIKQNLGIPPDWQKWIDAQKMKNTKDKRADTEVQYPDYFNHMGYDPAQIKGLVRYIQEAVEAGHEAPRLNLFVIDSGTHEVGNPNNEFVDGAYSYVEGEENDPIDGVPGGHGSTILEILQNNGSIVPPVIPAELNPYIDTYTLKAADENGTMSIESLTASFKHILDEHDKDPSKLTMVIASWGYNQNYRIIQDFVKACAERGIVIFASIGNSGIDVGPDSGNVHLPSGYPDLIGVNNVVSATAAKLVDGGYAIDTDWSNYGGSNNVATMAEFNYPAGPNGDQIDSGWGTSGTNAFNAGAAALASLADQITATPGDDPVDLVRIMLDTRGEGEGDLEARMLNVKAMINNFTPPGDFNRDFAVDLGDAIDAGKTVVGIPTDVDASKDISGDGKIGVEEMIYNLMQN